ncbi:hypothetical protein F442_08223 [Phytophthora nicotianae P10297]|uniref:Pectate lyase n=2 Tax=Phytophthora nicotianae TaxID=4792 RepID=W2ZDI5_PHYNI|nr:hypothetical protein F442_08223 [Phytophthora nicotianae P10297]
MYLQVLATLFAALVTCAIATVDHDKVKPFPQPEPATISEKAAIKFKPQLYIPEGVCVSYPAVNDAGETTGGLKGTNGNDACKYAQAVHSPKRVWFQCLRCKLKLEQHSQFSLKKRL